MNCFISINAIIDGIFLRMLKEGYVYIYIFEQSSTIKIEVE